MNLTEKEKYSRTVQQHNFATIFVSIRLHMSQKCEREKRLFCVQTSHICNKLEEFFI